MKRFASAAVVALVWASPQVVTGAPEGGPTSMVVLRDGVGASALEVALVAADGPKRPLGRPGPEGDLAIALAGANLGKVRVQVILEQCRNAAERLLLVVEGVTLPEEQGCRRRLVGTFWWHKARRLVVDVGRGTVSTGGSLLSRRNTAIAGGAASALLVAIVAGGGSGSTADNTTIAVNGNYSSSVSVASDPGGHASFIALNSSIVLTFAASGSTLTVTCPPGTRWIPGTGTFDPSTGRFTVTGRGLVAGRNNVGVRFEGSVDRSGRLTGTYTVGTGGELPGGQATVYTVMAQRQ